MVHPEIWRQQAAAGGHRCGVHKANDLIKITQIVEKDCFGTIAKGSKQLERESKKV
jgi:hypothetical protein